ncbi:MAG: carbohydrate ABC transporter permease [Thermomicrobiales bacterium]
MTASWRRWRAGVLFLLPSLALYLTFVVNPFIQSISFSLTDWNGASKMKEFVGLANYGELVRDPLFWGALRHNIVWVIIGTLVPLIIGMGLAHMLWTRPRGFTLFRTVYFLPHVLLSTVIGIIWAWIYNPIFGILNKGLDAVGLQSVSRGWLGDPDTALLAVLAAAIWGTVGFVFVILLAGLQNVSRDLLEAATLDGASGWQKFRDVTIPEMANVLNVVTALLLIGGFAVFDLVYVMTGGGPNNASQTLSTYTYEQAFAQNRVGYGAALSLVMTGISLVAALVFMRLRERGEEPR